MCLFGSYARGEADDDSNVDLYVDKGKMNSLIKNMSFVYELENELNCHVDVVTIGKQYIAAWFSMKSGGYFYYKLIGGAVCKAVSYRTKNDQGIKWRRRVLRPIPSLLAAFD